MIDGYDDYKNRMEDQRELKELREKILKKDQNIKDLEEEKEVLLELSGVQIEDLKQENNELKKELRNRWERIKELDKLSKEKNEQWLKTYHDAEARAVYHEAATATMKIQIDSLRDELEAKNVKIHQLEERVNLDWEALHKQRLDELEVKEIRIHQLEKQRLKLIHEIKRQTEYIAALEHDVRYFVEKEKQ